MSWWKPSGRQQRLQMMAVMNQMEKQRAQQEALAREAMAKQQEAIDAQRTDEKNARTKAAAAVAGTNMTLTPDGELGGFAGFGIRSLLSGRRGGAGFGPRTLLG